ncbi:LEM domain-containing protein 1 [Astyanax mexicanus]|uniref:LEM domain-containing protein 1 n=1 Tax=Astyanax mexicanus TaxID=7994 RepID=UPI0020CB4AA3|nr:LEM domain-containing protein 1 [Astyanax mexicanus]
MPVFIEDPTEFSKEQLRAALISHNVELPPGESRKEVYVDLYLKHVRNKNSADFSSDDEDLAQNDTEEEEQEEEADMVDLGALTDDQLKKQLLRYGVKAGPIVGSTRALYERKLQRLMAHPLQSRVNGTRHAAKYSDSEVDEGEDEEEEEDDEEEDDDEEESGSEQLGPESAYRTGTSATCSTVGKYNKSGEFFYPQCFIPKLRQEKKQQRQLESSRSSSHSFSVTQMVEEIESRLSPRSKPAETERRFSQTPVASRVQWDLQGLNGSTVTNTTLYLTPEYLPHQKQAEPATDILMELFPDTATTPTGITATKRRSIKGAAGRPVKFKYTETPLSPASLERREIQQHLLPLWVQIIVFLLVAVLLCFIYILMEDGLENPFSAVLDSLSEQPIPDQLTLITSSQDVSTSETVAA